MTLAWIASAHTDLHHNANLWLFWPTDWIYLVCGIALLRRGIAADFEKRSWRFGKFAALLHVISAGGMYMLYFGGILKQEVSNILLFLVPAILLGSIILVLPQWQKRA